LRRGKALVLERYYNPICPVYATKIYNFSGSNVPFWNDPGLRNRFYWLDLELKSGKQPTTPILGTSYLGHAYAAGGSRANEIADAQKIIMGMHFLKQ